MITMRTGKGKSRVGGEKITEPDSSVGVVGVSGRSL